MIKGAAWASDSPFGHDRFREAFVRLPTGELRQLDSCSEDAEVIAAALHYRPEMRFRLTYDGMLRSSSNDPRLEEKWSIRKHLQPQLAELWDTHPALQGHAMGYGGPLTIDMTTLDPDVPIRLQQNKERLQGYRATVAGHPHTFLPLVRSELLLTCSLDILFLRKDSPGSVVQAGDLDNRLTTLFDGLRMPRDKNEMASVETLGANPFHCLLEDDKLVTSLTVRTDRLLSRPNADKNEVRLIMDVIVSPTRIKMDLNSGFVAD